MLAHRGLLSTEARFGASLDHYGRSDVARRIENAIRLLENDPPGGFHWRERAQWARRLLRGLDDYGRRVVLSDAARLDARYVSATCARAWQRGVLPSGRQWGNLRASIQRLDEFLAETRRRGLIL